MKGRYYSATVTTTTTLLLLQLLWILSLLEVVAVRCYFHYVASTRELRFFMRFGGVPEVCAAVKGGLPYGKRDLLYTQKRPTNALTHLRYAQLSKEAQEICKREPIS